MAFIITDKSSITLNKEVEGRILLLHQRMAKITQRYKMELEKASFLPQCEFIQRILSYQELFRLQNEIRSIDKRIKDEIQTSKKMSPVPPPQIPQQGQQAFPAAPNSKGKGGGVLGGNRRSNRQKSPTPAAPTRTSTPPTNEGSNMKRTCPFSPPPYPHPSTMVKKEEFIEYLGLISWEELELRKKQQTSKKVERRRRTATRNTKYFSNGFLKLEDVNNSAFNRRSNRLGGGKVGSPSKALTTPTSPSSSGGSGQNQVANRNCCFVCYKEDCDLSCETCRTKFHSECIRVTGSNAPVPHRLPICPKCVEATNTSQIVRIQGRNAKPAPSIMHSPGKLKRERERALKKADQAMILERTIAAMKDAAIAVLSSTPPQKINCDVINPPPKGFRNPGPQSSGSDSGIMEMEDLDEGGGGVGGKQGEEDNEEVFNIKSEIKMEPEDVDVDDNLLLHYHS